MLETLHLVHPRSPVGGTNDHNCPSVHHTVHEGQQGGNDGGKDLVTAAAVGGACRHKAIQLIQEDDGGRPPCSLPHPPSIGQQGEREEEEDAGKQVGEVYMQQEEEDQAGKMTRAPFLQFAKPKVLVSRVKKNKDKVLQAAKTSNMEAEKDACIPHQIAA